ncbi:hypothetical protein GT037_005720, partial [Alternaria burnsii]
RRCKKATAVEPSFLTSRACLLAETNLSLVRGLIISWSKQTCGERSRYSVLRQVLETLTRCTRERLGRVSPVTALGDDVCHAKGGDTVLCDDGLPQHDREWKADRLQ